MEDATGDRRYLVGGTTSVLALRVLSVALGFGISVVVARSLGAAEYGVYQYVLSWVGLLSVASAFGLDQVVIREIAACTAREEWDLLKGILRWSIRFRIAVTIGITVLASAVISAYSAVSGARAPLALWCGLCLVPVLSLSNLANAALQGLRKVVVGLAADTLIARPLVLVSVIVASTLLAQAGLSAMDVICLVVIASTAALVLRLGALRGGLSHDLRGEVPRYRADSWLRSAVPLLIMAFLFELNTRTPILLLGSLDTKEATGVFGLCTTLVGLSAIILTSVNTVLGPVFSSLVSEGRVGDLQKLVTAGARFVAAAGGITLMLLVLTHRWVLGHFGPEYSSGAPVLLILASGQLVNLLGGPVGTVLVMTGNERAVTRAVGISAVITIVLGLVFIPLWGGVGGALSSLVSMAFWNLVLCRYSVKELGIDPTVLGTFSRH